MSLVQDKSAKLGSIREALASLIPREKALMMYHSFDLIGDIALIKVPRTLQLYELEVGEALHRAHPRIKKVFSVVGGTRETERTRPLKLIWTSLSPPDRTEQIDNESIGITLYHEHDCRFIVDVQKVFFSPRLAFERMRVAKQVKAAEEIAVMFGGVGTYAIIIAKTCPAVGKIYTIDINPTACELANRNAMLNKCSREVVAVNGDAKTICRDQLKDACNRVIMPLPQEGFQFLESAAFSLKKGMECYVNFYAEVSGKPIEGSVQYVIHETRKRMLDCGVRSCDLDNWRLVREIRPRRYHIAVDLKVTK